MKSCADLKFRNVLLQFVETFQSKIRLLYSRFEIYINAISSPILKLSQVVNGILIVYKISDAHKEFEYGKYLWSASG